jgi:hypothetical protein
MSELKIKSLSLTDTDIQADAEKMLESQTEKNSISTLNWPEYPYKPGVSFRIGHTENEIWLKFYVTEKCIRAVETRTNGDVYKDSCVEFFISFDHRNYYNFEFNCIGTRHLSYGPGRGNRARVNPEVMEKIQTHSTLGNEPFDNKIGHFEWEMLLRIPVEVFIFDSISSLKGIKVTGNFYKCGDMTEEPHFVTWNPVKTEKPDYHRPEFFGTLLFE